MNLFNLPSHSPSLLRLLSLTIGIATLCLSQHTEAADPASGVEGITLSDPGLRVELLDTHPDEFFLSHDMDLQGRLYLGSREAVFVYERTDEGGFQSRKELYRFPKDTWVYDLEAFGDDLLVLTNTALFRLQDALGADPKLEKILWGNPLGHHHQGMHGIDFAPDGDLLIVMGDPHPGVHLDKTRPDHLWMWTWYVGPDNRPTHYAGVGAVMRLNLDTYDLSVYASGLRNACGISLDRDWNLCANDNDQEGSTANPGRLISVPQHSWNSWARGWDTSQNPARLDMIPNLNWELDVPVGQGYYDDTTLGEEYRGSLFVANWGNRSVSRHPIESQGAGFSAKTLPFLRADGDRRPVSAMPTNRGNLIVSLCYMKGNEGSPYRQTDLVLVSPRISSENSTYDFSDKSLVELLSESVQIRAKAHREILRQGGNVLEEAAKAFVETDPTSPAFSSLIFLAAAHGDTASIERITSLAQGKGRSAVLAWRTAAAYPERFSALTEAVINTTAAKQDEPALLAGLLEFVHSAKPSIPNSVAALAAHDDPFVRQSAAILLARQASDDQLASLAQGNTDQRLASTLATSFRIWQRAEAVHELPEGGQVALEKHMLLLHPAGPIDLRELEAPVGIFRMADWWQAAKVRKANQGEFDRLQTALSDSEEAVANQAAIGLFFLNDDRVDAQVTSVLEASEINLSMVASTISRKDLRIALRALEGATLSTHTEIPEAFRKIDWDSETAPKGNVGNGQLLFNQRGCIACHLAPHNGAGGSIGPTLVGVGDRFPPSYLAASLLVPNLTVSPNFHPNTVTMKDGAIHTGFVETGGPPGMINLRVITGQIVELDKNEIAKQDASEQSMMPAGLVTTPEEMADLIAYMRDKPKKPARRKATPKSASQTPRQPVARLDALSDWDTTGNWKVDNEGAFVLTPRPGETNWKRYGDYLWTKQPYRDFAIAFEYKHEAGGNSGLYFNVTDPLNAVGSVIEVQIRDSAGEEELHHHDTSGGILPGVTPKANTAKPAGEWNTMNVTSLDGVVTVTLNGVLVNQVKLTEGRLKNKPKQGYVGFQDHGIPFWLRNVRLREL
jgi:putative heme-binding domain-containing protein